MPKASLEQRVAELERKMAQLIAMPNGATNKDWRRTIGMFSGDEFMKSIDTEGQRIREADRRRARGMTANATHRNRK